MDYKNMYDYYRVQQVLPTYGHFKSSSDLEAHQRHRRELFTVKLHLLPRIFEGAQLLEFGPDSGENSLVFAQWGANCTLVEPNLKAHPIIQEYFKRYSLSSRLLKLDAADISSYAVRPDSLQKYDIIDAEGFIYTVKPNSLWIDLFTRLLNDEGFIVLFYCEPFGSLIELMTKVIYARVKETLNKSAMDTAKLLFNTKWDSIPHRRRMESWVMDVLENPFIRLKYFLEAQALLTEMHEAGFSLYSSWPSYKDAMDVHWFKKIQSRNEQLQTQKNFVALSRLSHIFGRKHFMTRFDPDFEKALFELLQHVDGLINTLDEVRLSRCIDILDMICNILSSDCIIASPSEVGQTIAFIRTMQQMFRLLEQQSINEVVALCNSDESFIHTWGTPSHFGVFTLDGGTKRG